jgi:hypothetical protein
MKKPIRKPVKKRPARRSPARKPPRLIEGASKFDIIKMALEAVASVKIIGDQRTEELLELFRGVHDKWVVALKPSRKADGMLPALAEELPATIATATPPTIAKAVYAQVAKSGGTGTVVVMMVKETSQAQDV